MELHELCGNMEERRFPTRILDVGATSGDEIVLRNVPDCWGIYACLSHCWGFKASIKTTSGNLISHMQSISWDALPRTYQEAIAFCRELQIRYLWIDALCIVQDDQRDWAQESTRMASIYENSFITLAATGSTDHDGGLFHQHKPSTHSLEIGTWRREGKEHHVYGRKIEPHLDWTSKWQGAQRPDFSYTAAYDFPLLSRAWVYQERILSPRVLHFTKSELYWECREASKCECEWIDISAGKGKERHIKNDHALSIKSLIQKANITREPDLPDSVISDDSMLRWQSIVEEYSGLKLTYDKDKLPAVSGLAKQMHQHRNDEYLAGLWSQDILESLRWHVKHLEPLFPRAKEYVAPTWSWASIKSPVMYGGRLFGKEDMSHRATVHEFRRVHVGSPLLEATLFGAECFPSTVNQYGEVSGGYLDIEGLLRPAVVRRFSVYQNAQPTPTGPQPLSATSRPYVPHDLATPTDPLVTDTSSASDFYIQVPGFLVHQFAPDYAYGVEDRYHVPDGKNVFCLCLGFVDLFPERFHHLILSAVPGQVHVYERIGIAQLGVDTLAEPLRHERAMVKII